MSALGQKRTYAVHQVMSALPPMADILRAGGVKNFRGDCERTAADGLKHGIVPTRTNSSKGVSQCPLWVISRHVRCTRRCPLYPRKRHQMRHNGMSALGHWRTSTGVSGEAGGPAGGAFRLQRVIRPCRPVRGTPLLARQQCARLLSGNCPIRVDSRFCTARPYRDKSPHCD